jgi:hypothetical protein
MLRRMRGPLAAVLVVVLLAIGLPASVVAEPIGDPAFERTWARTDNPVATLRVSRTWMWGPEAYSPLLLETYDNTPGGQRLVQYFDKSRMEITNPGGDPNSEWYVTNGLLVVEMMSGEMQFGHQRFESFAPANVNVAGDFEDPDGPMYSTFTGLRNAQALEEGSTVIQRISRNGTITDDDGMAVHGVTVSNFVPDTGHRIAEPFWEFMNSSGEIYTGSGYEQARLFDNPFYATGFPITEPYWATVRVDTTPRDVLMQCFERRCLTFTPDNPDGWKVEAGNVGLHYYQWRYGGTTGQVPTAPPELPPLPPLDTPPPAEATGDAYFATIPPGEALPSSDECANRVRRYAWEPRPNNRLANYTRGHGIDAIGGANAEGQAALAWRVNGNFTGWTDEILQWGACKWGIDENVVRSIAVWQSWWHQWFTSNDMESIGIMSVHMGFHPGTYPASAYSTAFNIDYTLAWHRACYEGHFEWVGADTTGDLWGCVGLWRSGGWWDPVAADYVASVQMIIDGRLWRTESFWREHNPQ